MGRIADGLVAESVRRDDMPTEKLPSAVEADDTILDGGARYGARTVAREGPASTSQDPALPEGDSAEPTDVVVLVPADEPALDETHDERDDERDGDAAGCPDGPADASHGAWSESDAEMPENAPAAVPPAAAQPTLAESAPQPRVMGRWGPTRIVTGVVVLAVLGLIAWLVVTVLGLGGHGTAPATPPMATGEVAAGLAAFGEQVRGPDGWTVEIDKPTVLRPGADVDLPADADRAVRLQITLTNDGDKPRDSAGWTVKATADSRPVDLLPVDGRQGEAPSRTVLPGSSLAFTVAVPMPRDEVDLQLETARAGLPPAIFVGSA